MNKETDKKIVELFENAEKYMPLVKDKNSPIAFSVAKYYPALKKLAEQ